MGSHQIPPYASFYHSRNIYIYTYILQFVFLFAESDDPTLFLDCFSCLQSGWSTEICVIQKNECV